MEQALSQSGAALMYYKVNKVKQLFCITKQGKWYYKVWRVLQSGAIIAKKVSTEDKWENLSKGIDLGNQLDDSPLIYLVTDNLFLGIPKTLNLRWNQKKEDMTFPPQQYLRDL